jgi:Uma2 family endonuclease
MSTLAVPISPRPIIYPESDGKPMAENTLQYDWIVKITGGLRHQFAHDSNVFIAGDLFWYPVKDHPEICVAPDTLVVFGRPPGHRGSYRQWEEGGIAPQVVFEVLSPGNRFGEMSAKFDFYRRYGVEEYYICDPDPLRLELAGFLRQGNDLVPIQTMHGHVSPRLQVKFEMLEDGLRLLGPDGRPFVTFEEVALAEDQARREAEEQRREAEEQRREAEQQRRQTEEQRRRAEAAEKVALQERTRAEQLQAELDRLRKEPRS